MTAKVGILTKGKESAKHSTLLIFGQVDELTLFYLYDRRI